MPYGLTKCSCYVIAACSEKELPDRFTHSKKVHLNCLQISPRNAQYNGQKGAHQLHLTSPFAPLNCAQFTHAVGASTRMRRAPRQHILAVGETAPAFPARMPLYNRPITNHGSLPRPLAAIHASPNVESATLHRVLKTAVFALVRREFPLNNVDAETLLGLPQVESNRSRPAVPMMVARPTGLLRSRAAK